MDTVHIIVESNAEHIASVYALLASIIANKYKDSRYHIYLSMTENDEAIIEKFAALLDDSIRMTILSGSAPCNEIGKAVYLKWNTLVLGDLTDLYELDLEGYKIAAAPNLPAAVCCVPTTAQKFDDSVLLIDLGSLGILSNIKKALLEEVKEISVFFNLAYADLISNREKYKETDLKDIAGLPYIDLEQLKERAVILRASKERLPEQYFDHPFSEIWLKYYKSVFGDSLPLRRQAYAETLGTVSADNGNAVPIAIALTDKEVPYLIALLYSLRENLAAERQLDIRILYRVLSEKHKRMLLSMRTDGLSIILYNMKVYMEDNNPVYPMMLVPQIFDEYRKALYLQPKMICCADIGRLYDYDVEDYYFRAPKGLFEITNPEVEALAENLILGNQELLDTEVMLINTERWIRDEVNDRIRKLLKIKKYKQDSCQAVLHRICEGKMGSLPENWNLRQSVIMEKKNSGNIYDGIYKENPYLIYFDGSGSMLPYSDEKGGNPVQTTDGCSTAGRNGDMRGYENIDLIWKYMLLSPHYEELKEEALTYEDREDCSVKEVLERLQSLEKQNAQLKDKVAQLEAQNAGIGAERDQFLYELLETRKSFTYKIGRFMTFIPRKLRGTK